MTRRDHPVCYEELSLDQVIQLAQQRAASPSSRRRRPRDMAITCRPAPIPISPNGFRRRSAASPGCRR